jgi:hypothetical protein
VGSKKLMRGDLKKKLVHKFEKVREALKEISNVVWLFNFFKKIVILIYKKII